MHFIHNSLQFMLLLSCQCEVPINFYGWTSTNITPLANTTRKQFTSTYSGLLHDKHHKHTYKTPKKRRDFPWCGRRVLLPRPQLRAPSPSPSSTADSTTTQQRAPRTPHRRRDTRPLRHSSTQFDGDFNSTEAQTRLRADFRRVPRDRPEKDLEPPCAHLFIDQGRSVYANMWIKTRLEAGPRHPLFSHWSGKKGA